MQNLSWSRMVGAKMGQYSHTTKEVRHKVPSTTIMERVAGSGLTHDTNPKLLQLPIRFELRNYCISDQMRTCLDLLSTQYNFTCLRYVLVHLRLTNLLMSFSDKIQLEDQLDQLENYCLLQVFELSTQPLKMRTRVFTSNTKNTKIPGM